MSIRKAKKDTFDQQCLKGKQMNESTGLYKLLPIDSQLSRIFRYAAIRKGKEESTLYLGVQPHIINNTHQRTLIGTLLDLQIDQNKFKRTSILNKLIRIYEGLAIVSIGQVVAFETFPECTLKTIKGPTEVTFSNPAGKEESIQFEPRDGMFTRKQIANLSLDLPRLRRGQEKNSIYMLQRGLEAYLFSLFECRDAFRTNASRIPFSAALFIPTIMNEESILTITEELKGWPFIAENRLHEDISIRLNICIAGLTGRPIQESRGDIGNIPGVTCDILYVDMTESEANLHRLLESLAHHSALKEYPSDITWFGVWHVDEAHNRIGNLLKLIPALPSASEIQVPNEIKILELEFMYRGKEFNLYLRL